MNRKQRLGMMMVVLLLSLSIFAGCSRPIAQTTPEAVALSDQGQLVISVNPEVELTYDDQGMLKVVTGLNDDGKAIIKALTPSDNLAMGDAVIAVVKEMIAQGYLKAEQDNHIELELRKGSVLPTDDFMKNIVTQLQAFLKDNQLDDRLVVDDDSNYGVSSFGQSDYDSKKAVPAAPGKIKLNVDGDTHYDDSNYDDNDSNYDSNDSPYDDHDSNYDDPDTNYDDPDSNYDDSPYQAPAPAPAPAPVDDDSDYDDSGYDDSGYDDSGYDD